MVAGRSVVVLTTGGTIASAPSAEGKNRSGALSGDELASTLKLQVSADTAIRVVPVLQKPSNAVTFTDLIDLRRYCLDLALQSDVSGIVITHGTDTLEETAYFLDLTVPTTECALVLTGAQRAPHEVGSDAHRNLRDAIVVARDPSTRGFGALVVFNESVHAARSVRKVHTYHLAGFDSPGAGRIGYVDQEELFLERWLSQFSCLTTPGAYLPRVDTITTNLDASPAMLETVLATGAEGVVIEALGRGHVPPSWVEVVRQATTGGIPVAIVSGCIDGPLHQSYEFPGSLGDLETAGAIPLSGLSARKARIRLATLLSADHAGREGFTSVLQMNSTSGEAFVNPCNDAQDNSKVNA